MSVVLLSAVLTVKQQMLSRLFIVLAVVQPLVFLLFVVWLSDDGSPSTMEAMAGTSVMGMWSTTLFGAGRALQRERRYGTLELLLVSPTNLGLPLAGVCLGSAALGLMTAVSCALLVVATTGEFATVEGSIAFLVALVASVPFMAVLGLLIGGLFVLLRQASLLTNILEYPVWLGCGLLVPLSSRPGPLAVFGDVLTPTYISVLLRGAISFGTFDVRAVLITLALTAGYVVIASALVNLVIRRVRRRGDLAIT